MKSREGRKAKSRKRKAEKQRSRKAEKQESIEPRTNKKNPQPAVKKKTPYIIEK